jgi:hypothetical protein
VDASVRGGGLDVGLAYGLRNWIDIDAELAAVAFTHGIYDPATVALFGSESTGRLERSTRAAQLRLGATLRGGVEWVPVLFVGLGLGVRQRTAATLMAGNGRGLTPDGMTAGMTFDVTPTVRVGLEHRLGPRWTVGFDVSASHAFGIGSSSLEMVSASISLAYSWYPVL